VFAFCCVHDCIVTSHLHFIVLKQVFSMVIFFLFFGCCCYAHHVHGCITLVVCIKQLFFVLAFCFVGFCLNGLLVISFCLHFVMVTLYLHFATPKYFFSKFPSSTFIFCFKFLCYQNYFPRCNYSFFFNVLYMLVVERMASTNTTPIIIKKMVHEQDEFMSSTNAPMGSPPNWIKMGI
jgi:hypothetical protein